MEPFRTTSPESNSEQTDLETEEVALQPKGDDLQDDAQQDRYNVEDGVEGSFQDLLLVYVLTGCIQVEHSPGNENGYQLQCPENLQRRRAVRNPASGNGKYQRQIPSCQRFSAEV